MANIKKYVTPAASFSIGMSAGFVVGYFIRKRQLEQAYAAEASHQIMKDRERVMEEVQASDELVQSEYVRFHERREFIQIVQNAGYAAPENVDDIDALIDGGVSAEQYVTVLNDRVKTSVTPPEEEEVLLFEAAAETGDQFAYEAYCEDRDTDGPHIIHISEYMEDDARTKITLRYYEGDETLVDSANKPIPDVRNLLGDLALDNFGKFSQDNNIVYIRNPHQDADFEVIKDSDSWVTVAFGVPQSADARPKVGKMREDD